MQTKIQYFNNRRDKSEDRGSTSLIRVVRLIRAA